MITGMDIFALWSHFKRGYCTITECKYDLIEFNSIDFNQLHNVAAVVDQNWRIPFDIISLGVTNNSTWCMKMKIHVTQSVMNGDGTYSTAQQYQSTMGKSLLWGCP